MPSTARPAWPLTMLLSAGGAVLGVVAVGGLIAASAILGGRGRDEGANGPAPVVTTARAARPPVVIAGAEAPHVAVGRVGGRTAAAPAGALPPLRTDGLDNLFESLRAENARVAAVRPKPEAELTASRGD